MPLSSSQLAARRFRDISWELAETTHGLDVSITAQETPLKELVLRWDLDFPKAAGSSAAPGSGATAARSGAALPPTG